jgi:hypothetical protein
MEELLDISGLRLRDRPLIVCDIDEVVLEFISPFTAFLRTHNYDLLPRSFRLHGNIVSLLDGTEPGDAEISAFQESFFSTQDQWQKPAIRAVETLAALSDDADIVFLTAMPPRHRAIRRTLLDSLGLAFPMIATEEPKGPVVAQIHGRRSLPVAFLDDIAHNLHSVRQHVPHCLLITMMANADFRAFVPAPTDGIVSAADWDEAATVLRSHFAGDP